MVLNLAKYGKFETIFFCLELFLGSIITMIHHALCPLFKPSI